MMQLPAATLVLSNYHSRHLARHVACKNIDAFRQLQEWKWKLLPTMNPLSKKDVEHIAKLAYIKLSEKETEDLRMQLSNILSHFASLSTVKTDGIEATGHTTDSNTVMRNDHPEQPLDQNDVLRNAPDRDGEFVRVRPVLE